MLIMFVIVLAACTTVQITEQGQNVRVGYDGDFAVDGCRFIKAVDMKAPRAFDPGTPSQHNMINTVRNEAHKYGANAAKIVGGTSALFRASAHTTVEYYEC